MWHVKPFLALPRLVVCIFLQQSQLSVCDILAEAARHLSGLGFRAFRV